MLPDNEVLMLGQAHNASKLTTFVCHSRRLFFGRRMDMKHLQQGTVMLKSPSHHMYTLSPESRLGYRILNLPPPSGNDSTAAGRCPGSQVCMYIL